MNKKISLFILMILILSLFGSSPTPVNAVTWWNSDWSYKMKITINATKVDADLTDFPVLVYLNSSRIDWTHVQDDLDDLTFTDSTETVVLMAELENYTVNDEAWIWVKIPTIDDVVNTDFYLYYGNNVCSSYWNPEDVWEDSAVMVQHMRDNPDNAHVMDSTQYDNDGTKVAANEPIETASGKINDAQDFDGNNDNIDITHSTSLNIIDAITIEIWIKRTELKSFNYPIVKIKGPASWECFSIRMGGNTFIGSISIGDVTQAIFSNDNFIQDRFYHLVITYDGSKVNGYVDGIKQTYEVPIVGTIDTSTDAFRIGRFGTGDEAFHGFIDEIRVYKDDAKSAEWILADYYSGSDNLLIYGVESLVPLALTVRYNIGINKLYINDTQIANNTTIYIDQNTTVNATAISQSNYIFYRHILDLSGVSLIPMYLFNMTQPFTLWSYATPNFYIYEEPTTFTFTHWIILLFIALVISLLAAIKFHIIATVSLILVLYMVINVASYTGIILLAIIVWLLTIMFSIIAFGEI